MAQYKHSRLASLKLSDSDVNGRTFGGTMLAFIFALILMLVAAGIVSIGITFTTDSTPDRNTDKGTLILSDSLALDGPYSSHVTSGWTFVPNITPEMVEASLSKAGSPETEHDGDYWPSSELTAHRAYAENIRISDTWRGWFDYDSDEWHNTDSKNINYQRFSVEDTSCISAAYIGHLECSQDIQSLSLTFHKFNGTAWVFCNGEYVDRIGARTPFFNLNAFADYCTLIPDNGRLDLVIVVSCTPQVANPGILSEPIIETRTANDVRTVITAGHFAIVTLIFFVAIAVGSNIILNSTKNKWLFLSFFISFAAILMYYLDDCRFISVDSHIRADLRFVLLIVASAASFLENSQLFAGTNTQNKFKLLKKGHYIVFAAGLSFIVAYYVCDLAFGILLPEFIAIMFALTTVTLCIFINLFFYNKENQKILLWALLFGLMFFVLFLAILMDGMIVYTIPTYSNIFVFFSLIAEITLVSTYLNQQREIKRNAAVLKRQVREKTVFISEINRDLVLTNKKLMEGEVARKNVLSNVSHDLRTPITAIRGYAELMISAQDNLSLEQRNSYLSNIVRRSEQMERIVSDIMELTRMESSDSDFHFTSVSIAEMLDELVVMYSMDLENSEKHLSLDLPSRDSLIVKADPAKLSRVFENLISNAINYTGPQAEISVKAWRSGDASHIVTQKIHITVEDNGIGIPEQDLPRIFDRFYRAQNSGVNIKGTGLGLAIVKLICDKHDAEISVKSTLGKGTTFEVIMSASY
jgi:signal transduction histidine kinase